MNIQVPITPESETSRVLEDLIDASDVGHVLSALVDICNAKADHLRSNWQDNVSARAWDQAARTIDKAILKVRV